MLQFMRVDKILPFVAQLMGARIKGVCVCTNWEAYPAVNCLKVMHSDSGRPEVVLHGRVLNDVQRLPRILQLLNVANDGGAGGKNRCSSAFEPPIASGWAEVLAFWASNDEPLCLVIH